MENGLMLKSIIGNAIIYNTDCKILLQELPNNSVDLVVTSPPYCMGKSYENPKNGINEFVALHLEVFPQIIRILKENGSLCWQIGSHVSNNEVVPLDYLVYDILINQLDNTLGTKIKLRNRIIWTFGHGLNSTRRFSGRYETILWFTKGEGYTYNLDAVRIPQKYPGKKHYKGDKIGEFSGNPLGKNPGDVWEIPNVKANHIEKTCHPCQFPVSVPARLIKSLTNPGDLVMDPFFGVCSTGVAALLEDRRFVGTEINTSYFEIAKTRLEATLNGEIRFRPDVPVMKPDPQTSVAQKPEFFA